MQKQRQMINICDINTYIDIIGSAIIVIELYVLFSKKYFYQGTEELDFEETSEKYRFFCAMMQSDDWEMLQSKNKKSEK